MTCCVSSLLLKSSLNLWLKQLISNHQLRLLGSALVNWGFPESEEWSEVVLACAQTCTSKFLSTSQVLKALLCLSLLSTLFNLIKMQKGFASAVSSASSCSAVYWHHTRKIPHVDLGPVMYWNHWLQKHFYTITHWCHLAVSEIWLWWEQIQREFIHDRGRISANITVIFMKGLCAVDVRGRQKCLQSTCCLPNDGIMCFPKV